MISAKDILNLATKFANVSDTYTPDPKDYPDDNIAYTRAKLSYQLVNLLNQINIGNPSFIDYTGDNFVEVHPNSYEVNVLLMQSPHVDAWKKKGAKDLSHPQFEHLVHSLAKALQSAFQKGRIQITDEQSDACEMKNVSLFIDR